MLSRFYDSWSHKVACWYSFAGVWKMKRRLLLNLNFSRKVLSVCPVYYMGMLYAMVINKSISSENLVLVFQLTCWQTLVNAIAQISSCCNPWKCYNHFYKTKPEEAAPHRIHIANTWMGFNVCRAFSQFHYIPLKQNPKMYLILSQLH